MAEQFKKLRAAGDWGGHLADVLTLLTANWPLVVSAILAIATGGVGAFRAVALTPPVYAGAGAFLVLLWTIIGILALVDRRKPRLVRADQDYRYGLVFEGFVPNFMPTNMATPDAGGLQFGIQMRNWSPGPIKYTVENVDVRIGSRAAPKYKTAAAISGYMARGAARTANPVGFAPGTLAEFYGKGRTEGTAEFSISYGAPDGIPVRRLRISLDLTLIFPKDGAVGPLEPGLGYANNIMLESDEPI